ncbi:hypothetical protein BKA61DRAFT_738159 [Leptodontidium sp. MPI-SDFR-AT-0119]|nr:hypothetical protein BKA61DRAFT_738159 [Leptodontidium sp. MPI-SDFR-AT-0119]
MKRPSDVEGETYSSKRQRVASVASQDSDENGQNPLGISFGEAEVAPFTSAPAESPDLEIADSQEDANDNEEGAKPASDKPSPDHISISSDDGKGAVVPPSLNDVKARLAARCFIFNIREIKIIVRWMRMHRTYKVTSHKAQFNELARYLGYTHPSLSQEDQAGLRSKLRVKMASFHINMKKSGAITDEHDGYESSGSNVFQPLPFAEWTQMWYKKSWDGSLNKPDKAKYEAIMNEPDDEDELSSDEENGDDQGRDAEKNTPPPSETVAPAEAEAPAVVGKSHHDDDYDGLEIFVVEEDPQLPDGVEPPPPKEDDFPEARAWNQYLLNKEIIDEHDWNYRVMVALNLGIDLKELAVLYPDPFPGYEPPSREGSASPATPTRTAASTVPSTPGASSSQPFTTTGVKEVRVFSRPHSDDSISIGSADSDDEEEVPWPEEEGYTEEEMGEDELEDEGEENNEDEEEDANGDIAMENDNASQASITNTVNGTADTQATSPEPRTPQRSISRQSRTPRSVTPVSYTAVWSPKDSKD